MLVHTLVLAESEDEARGVLAEARAVVDDLPAGTQHFFRELYFDAQLDLVPGDILVAAFDYKNASRMFVAQTAEEWAAHYGRPLILRAPAFASATRYEAASGYNYVDIWRLVEGRRSGSGDDLDPALRPFTHAACGNEAARRESVAGFLRGGYDAGFLKRVVELAREHSRMFLPAPLRKRASRSA
jgi:hypothetical protein